jgi:hypothetical protein
VRASGSGAGDSALSGRRPWTIASHSDVLMANADARASGSTNGPASVVGSMPMATSTSRPTPRTAHGSAPRATRSSSPAGSPSTLPSSRTAPRERNVGNAATSADRSRP